jgi:hypothetical protein
MASGSPEEVPLPFPAGVASPHQLHVGLVNQGGGLKRVAGRQACEAGLCQPPQLVVDQRQQLRGGPPVAAARGFHDLAKRVGL